MCWKICFQELAYTEGGTSSTEPVPPTQPQSTQNSLWHQDPPEISTRFLAQLLRRREEGVLLEQSDCCQLLH